MHDPRLKSSSYGGSLGLEIAVHWGVSASFSEGFSETNDFAGLDCNAYVGSLQSRLEVNKTG